jgi:hypothetical protein
MLLPTRPSATSASMCWCCISDPCQWTALLSSCGLNAPLSASLSICTPHLLAYRPNPIERWDIMPFPKPRVKSWLDIGCAEEACVVPSSSHLGSSTWQCSTPADIMTSCVLHVQHLPRGGLDIHIRHGGAVVDICFFRHTTAAS